MDATDDSFVFPVGARGRSRWLALVGLMLLAGTCWLGTVQASTIEALSAAWLSGAARWQQAAGGTTLVLVGATLLWWRPVRPPPTESLTILPALGLLLGSSSSPSAGDFLPVARISRVVVGEALEGFGARSYLGIVLSDRADVVIAFPGCRIGMADLERVHEAIQRRLWPFDGD